MVAIMKSVGKGCLFGAGAVVGFIVVVGLLIAVLGGGTSSDNDVASPTASSSSGADEGTTDVDSEEEVLSLGEVHSYDVGLTGTGWDISIDGYERIDLGVLKQPDDSGECLVVTGTATARSVDTEDGLSNIFSFPSVDVVVGGVKADNTAIACDAQPDGYADYLTGVEMSFAQGGTGKWLTVVNIKPEGAEIDWISLDGIKWDVSAANG